MQHDQTSGDQLVLHEESKLSHKSHILEQLLLVFFAKNLNESKCLKYFHKVLFKPAEINEMLVIQMHENSNSQTLKGTVLGIHNASNSSEVDLVTNFFGNQATISSMVEPCEWCLRNTATVIAEPLESRQHNPVLGLVMLQNCIRRTHVFSAWFAQIRPLYSFQAILRGDQRCMIMARSFLWYSSPSAFLSGRLMHVAELLAENATFCTQ